jgi:hypothetical protein
MVISDGDKTQRPKVYSIISLTTRTQFFKLRADRKSKKFTEFYVARTALE